MKKIRRGLLYRGKNLYLPKQSSDSACASGYVF